MTSTDQDLQKQQNKLYLLTFACTVIVFSTVMYFLTSGDDNQISSQTIDSETGDLPPAALRERQITEDPPTLVIEIFNSNLSVTGVVANAKAGDRIAFAVNNTFGTTSETKLKLNVGADSPAWENEIPDLVKNLGAVIEGELTITETETILTGTAPDSLYLEELQNFLTSENSFPPLNNQIEIVALGSPRAEITVASGKADIQGQLTKETTDNILSSLHQLYGQTNTSKQITETNSVYDRVDLIRSDALIAPLVPFNTFKITVDNNELIIEIKDNDYDSAATTLSDDTRTNYARIAKLVSTSTYPVSITELDGTGEASPYVQGIAALFVDEEIEESRITTESIIEPSPYNIRIRIAP